MRTHSFGSVVTITYSGDPGSASISGGRSKLAVSWYWKMVWTKEGWKRTTPPPTTRSAARTQTTLAIETRIRFRRLRVSDSRRMNWIRSENAEGSNGAVSSAIAHFGQ